MTGRGQKETFGVLGMFYFLTRGAGNMVPSDKSLNYTFLIGIVSINILS